MTVPRQRARHRAAGDSRRDDLQAEHELALLLDRLHGPDHHVRPAALRELGALADDCPEVRAPAVGALCAWLRSPWAVDPRTGDTNEAEQRRAGLALLSAHLRDPNHPTSWVGHDLDLAGAVLAGADLSGCWFTGGQVRLEGAWAIEGRLSFVAAHFAGADVSLRHWTSGQGDLDFSGSRFTGGVVTLAGATLDRGVVSFAGAVVDGGTIALTEATVRGATVDLSAVTVTRGTVSLEDADLAAGRVLLIDARLMGGVTALRHADLADGVLATSGAQASPGALLH